MREYAMVLHLHKLEPPRLVGPVYLYPDGRGGIVKAARDETVTPAQPRRILTTPIACGLQVSRNFARILIKRVKCLDITRQLPKAGWIGDIAAVSYPVPR